jgi:ribosome-associated heat shock protein Hsp15
MASSTSKRGVKEFDRMRLDKWLWAARFYKTRAIAKKAIEGGKVRCQGARPKPGKEIEVGMQISLRQGFDEKTVIVKLLSEQRRGAPEAQLLYEETDESVVNRERIAEQRKAQPRHWPSATKPNKKQRRMIQRFKQGESS